METNTSPSVHTSGRIADDSYVYSYSQGESHYNSPATIQGGTPSNQPNTQVGHLYKPPTTMNISEEEKPFTFYSQLHTYTVVKYPITVSECEIWMRTVNRHLSSLKVPKRERLALFTSLFGKGPDVLKTWRKRHPKERQLDSLKRISYKLEAHAMVPAHFTETRARKRIKRAVIAMKDAHSDTYHAIAALIRHGLLKSGGKYDQFRRAHTKASKGKGTYGITVAQYPRAHTVEALANAIYHHPLILTETPEWVLKYRKGRLKIVDDALLLPTQQLTLSHMSLDYKTDQDVVTAIQEVLSEESQSAIAIRVRKSGYQLDVKAIAAHVFFETEYHARCAVRTLKSLGRVSLGRTVVTSRVIASNLDVVVRMLLSEADGKYADDLTPEQLKVLNNNPIDIPLQEWIDKDGRVSFIKVKLVDPSHHVFKNGESRVAYLVEFVGDEGECRRFYPALVDQFDVCNRTLFTLLNGAVVKVLFTLSSGDHKAAWAKTGRSGGHDKRDLFSNFSSATMYHLVAYQDKPSFGYSRHVESWRAINNAMETWRSEQIHAHVIVSKVAERVQLMKIYRIHGRVERVPALANGETKEQPSVYSKLRTTPLVLHNQSFCCLTTLSFLNHFIKTDSKALKKLHGRYKGLCDGFGVTKCATSGSGIRILCNDAVILEQDHKLAFKKFAPVWYLIDTICYHVHLKGKNTQGTHLALLDFERLCFSSSTLMWWLLIGDASEQIGGRALKTGNKNHLQDKIYAYEFVNACPEWEEQTGIPLSLIDESIFEASFSARDEMINATRSKVDIEAERKMNFFKRALNTLAPNRQYRSILSGMPQHRRRNMVILACWRSQTKWSFNIGTGFFSRIAQYTYHHRVTLSTTHAIYFNVQGPPDPFDTKTPPEDLVICACGNCDTSTPPTDFPISLRQWWAAKRIQRAWQTHRLWTRHQVRLKRGHLRRAIQCRAALESQLAKSKQQPGEVKALYDAYKMYQDKYPESDDLKRFTITPRLNSILQKANDLANRVQNLWDGDFRQLPTDISDILHDKKWTCAVLKSVLRFFKLHGMAVKLTATRAFLANQVQPLLDQYYRLCNLSP